jgi:hypothetical protein
MTLTRGCVLLLCATASGFGQNKQFTARELFYSATQPPAQTQAPPKTQPAPPAPPKTATIKTPSRATHTPPKPVEIARSDNQDAGVQVISASQTAPMPSNGQPPLGLRINVLRYNADGSTTEVLPDTVFHSGDRIRLSVEPNAKGYLYIANQGTSGTWKAMFPSPEIEDGDNRAEAMRPYAIPPGNHVFTFDATAGKENLFVVFSRQPVPDFEELIYSLKSGKPASGPNAPLRSEKTLVATANIGDKTIDRLRSASGRDLIIETVNPSTPGPKQETAVYVVNPTGSADSRVVADIKLVHQ